MCKYFIINQNLFNISQYGEIIIRGGWFVIIKFCAQFSAQNTAQTSERFHHVKFSAKVFN